MTLPPKAGAGRAGQKHGHSLELHSRTEEPSGQLRVLFAVSHLGLPAAFRLALPRCLNVLAASNTSSALQHLARSAPDLVILEHDGAKRAVIDNRAVLEALGRRSPRYHALVVSPCPPGSVLCELAPYSVVDVVPAPMTFAALRAVNRALFPSRRPCPRPLSRHVSRAVEYIGSAYERATVAMTADAAAVSPGHLVHSFRRELGMPVVDFIGRVRVDVACRLLIETDHKQETIAEIVGFSDAAHLSHRFQHYRRQRPGDYRRNPSPAEGAP